MKESCDIIFSRCSIWKERAPNLSKTFVYASTMKRLHSYYSTCAHGCSLEFMYCDNAVIGVTLEQTPRELSVLL